MIERILVPLDGSALAERALPFAVRLAAATGARLLLMHGAEPVATLHQPPLDIETFARRLRESEAIGALTATRRIEIEAVGRKIPIDTAAEAICQAAADQQADLIVMSTHGRGGLGRWLYGSVADQVLRRAPAPVLLISATCDHEWPAHGPLRILVPLDGSKLSEAVLGPVGELAATLPAELILVGATGPLEYGYADGVPFTRTGLEGALEEVRAYLGGVAERLRADGHAVEVVAEVGRPGPVIEVAAREQKADLIAMATHGRGGIARLALGSVATETLQRAGVPLLVTRPVGVRQPAEATSARAQSGAGPAEPAGTSAASEAAGAGR